MKSFKDLNKFSVILIIFAITLLVSRCLKQRDIDKNVLEGGDIQHAIDTQQYSK